MVLDLSIVGDFFRVPDSVREERAGTSTTAVRSLACSKYGRSIRITHVLRVGMAIEQHQLWDSTRPRIVQYYSWRVSGCLRVRENRRRTSLPILTSRAASGECGSRRGGGWHNDPSRPARLRPRTLSACDSCSRGIHSEGGGSNSKSYILVVESTEVASRRT